MANGIDNIELGQVFPDDLDGTESLLLLQDETLTDIYVDLTRDDHVGAILDPETGAVVCNQLTKIGTPTNPISLREFREYLFYDHDIDQTFYLSGSVAFDVFESSDVGLLGGRTLFETPHQQRNIKITNWFDASIDIQNPWHITVYSSSQVDEIGVFSNLDNLEMHNGQIELSASAGTSRFAFGEYRLSNDPRTISQIGDNSLVLSNMKLYADYESTDVADFIHSYAFNNYKKQLFINTLINNKQSDGSIMVRNDYSLESYISSINSIFSNISEIIGYPDSSLEWFRLWGNSLVGIDKDVNATFHSCVFSSNITNLTDQPGGIFEHRKFKNLIVDEGYNQFNWPIASACGEALITLSQSLNFDYIGTDWVTISAVSGVQINEYDNVQDRFTSIRDGIGPFTFVEMPDVYISANPDSVAMTESAVFTNRDTSYDVTYLPNGYEWDFGDDNVSATTSGGVEHTYLLPNYYDISMDVYSRNRWYSKTTDIKYRVELSGSDYTLDLYKWTTDGFDTFLVSATSASIFDTIVMSAVNVSEYPEDIVVYESWSHDFSDTYSGNISSDLNDGFKYSNGTEDESHIYISSGVYDVYFTAKQSDNTLITKYKTLDVYNHDQSIYYVDLSLEYEDINTWITKPTIINDDFEIGALDSGWGVTFKSMYGVATMWDEMVAYGDGSVTQLLDNPFHYDFDAEFSFVREERETNTIFEIKSILNSVLKIEWDYVGDRILVYHYGELIIVPYNLKDYGYVKDLRCSNSLRKLKIKITNDDGGNLTFQYSMDGVNWINTTILDDRSISDVDKRLLVDVTTNDTTGFGYIRIQSKYGLPYTFGSEDVPLTYNEFKARVEINGIGDYNDKYLCRNHRKIAEPLNVNSSKYYEIDSWDMDRYGPWMIIVDYNTNITKYEGGSDVSFVGCMISNGIIYNLAESSNGNRYAINLKLSFAYDMFIVWQGVSSSSNNGVIELLKSKWMNRTSEYKEIVGGTIKSENGIIDRR